MLPSEPGNQRVSPVRPLLAGDMVDGRRVAGFAWVGTGGAVRSTHLDDRLLLDGDEHLAVPPDRPVPQTADGAVPDGIVPPGDLPAGSVRQAGSIDPTIPLRADALLDLPGAAWQPLVRPLLAAVHATGHQAWLAGGAARDVLAGVPLHEVNDLDLAGTVPPGRFSDIAYQALRATKMTEFRTTVTPGSLVCAVVRPRSSSRLIEYRGLTRGGFRFPAVGSRLAEDALHRDFSFNALLYDVLEHTVFDASGRGVDDLLGEIRRFHPVAETGDPLARGMIVLRAMKFALRWADDSPLDLDPLFTWISALPSDLCQTLSRSQWNGLSSAYKRTTTASRARQRQFAATLPEPGRELLETLIGPAR